MLLAGPVLLLEELLKYIGRQRSIRGSKAQ
jgi:hypothetical protein